MQFGALIPVQPLIFPVVCPLRVGLLDSLVLCALSLLRQIVHRQMSVFIKDVSVNLSRLH